MITREEFELIKVLHKQQELQNFTYTKTLFESKQNVERSKYDIFLSYSSEDRDDAMYVLSMLKSKGFIVYVDFEDKSLDRNNVSYKTAQKLASIIKKCSMTLYLHSTKSSISKWCPWELGFTEGANKKGAMMIIQEKATTSGQEYLDLYPSIRIHHPQFQKNDFDFIITPHNQLTSITLQQYIKS